MSKLTSASRILNHASIIALLVAIFVLAIPTGVYFATGIEMLWLVNAGVVAGGGAFILFATFISVVAATWIKDSCETDDDSDVEVDA